MSFGWVRMMLHIRHWVRLVIASHRGVQKLYIYIYIYTLPGSLINMKLLCSIHMITFIFSRNNTHDTFCFLVYCMFCEALLSGIVFKCFEVLFESHGKCASSWTCIFYRTVRTFQLIHTIFHMCFNY
jgi:hypothetical protein